MHLYLIYLFAEVRAAGKLNKQKNALRKYLIQKRFNLFNHFKDKEKWGESQFIQLIKNFKLKNENELEQHFDFIARPFSRFCRSIREFTPIRFVIRLTNQERFFAHLYKKTLCDTSFLQLYWRLYL